MFACDSVNPLVQLTALCERKETGDSKPKGRNGDKLELKHFHDQTLAQDYVCKICQFIVVDPREHNVIGSTFTCASLFCYNCICNWIKSGKSYCPSPGCLTIGFEESAFREIGARDVARLSGLMMNCPFSCGLKLTYSDYTFLSHRNQCPSNPENMCKVCKSTKLNSDGGYDCKIGLDDIRQKIDSLNIKVSELTLVIDQLRSELATAKKAETNTKTGPLESQNTTIIKDAKETNDQEGKESIKVLTTFYSNSYLPKPGSFSGVNLVFHYGERSINFDDVQSTYTIRTLRSLITDTLGHDPGQMLFMRHKLINDEDVIKHCGFRMGNNVITMLRTDTPNYGKPGFSISLNLPRESQTSDDSKQSRLLNFYSNNLDYQQEANTMTFTLMFGKSRYMKDYIYVERTMGGYRKLSGFTIGYDAIKMVYLTHLTLEDNMTVSHYGFPPGRTDITLVPANCPLTYDANGALHLNQFLTRKDLRNRPPYEAYKTYNEPTLVIYTNRE